MNEQENYHFISRETLDEAGLIPIKTDYSKCPPEFASAPKGYRRKRSTKTQLKRKLKAKKKQYEAWKKKRAETRQLNPINRCTAQSKRIRVTAVKVDGSGYIYCESMREAGRVTGTPYRTVQNIINGLRADANGYYFKKTEGDYTLTKEQHDHWIKTKRFKARYKKSWEQHEKMLLDYIAKIEAQIAEEEANEKKKRQK